MALPPVIGPSHAVLVGPSGSGKSSVLAALTAELEATLDGMPHPSRGLDGTSEQDLRMAFFGRPLRLGWTREREVTEGWRDGRWIAVSLPAQRQPFEKTDGTAPDAPDSQRSSARVSGHLAGLIVHRQVELRVARQAGDDRRAGQLEGWQLHVRDVLRRILGDEALTLVVGETDLAIDFSDGRRLPLEALASGHASALSIWAELFVRAEASRRRTEDPGFDPKGVLLLDAAEVFLDPRLQRVLLPLLVEQFPGVQVVAATSSPIVAASLPQATVLDLAARTTRKVPSLPPPSALPAKPDKRPVRRTHEGSGPWGDE